MKWFRRQVYTATPFEVGLLKDNKEVVWMTGFLGDYWLKNISIVHSMKCQELCKDRLDERHTYMCEFKLPDDDRFPNLAGKKFWGQSDTAELLR